jgi:hypothetical protein
MKKLLMLWHNWRYNANVFRFMKAIGKIEDLKEGPRSLAMRMAVYDRYQAELTLCQHLAAQGKPHPVIELPEEQIRRLNSPSRTPMSLKDFRKHKISSDIVHGF